MSPVATKDCFPPADKCHNCLRKFSSQVKKKPAGKKDNKPCGSCHLTTCDLDCDQVKEPVAQKDYKRCGRCHLLTYCDADCQREHWTKVHKHHCRFLSGKVQVKNSKHDPTSCILCIEERDSSLVQLRSVNSPKTTCNIDEIAIVMKENLGQAFGFHEEGKEGHCWLEFPCELPFPLGEVSGQYVEKGTAGLDAMLAHVLKILNAMLIKAQEDRRIALSQLWNDVINARCLLWFDILVSGIPRVRSQNHLYAQVESLQISYGASNPWWKCLRFSVYFIVTTYLNLKSNFYDSQSLEDTRFQKLKLRHDYRQSELQNQAKVFEMKSWPNFMLWPTFANGSLAVLLPPSTRCHSCNDELCGEVAVTPHEVNAQYLPLLFFRAVGDNGALMASCSITKNPNCRKACDSKDVEYCRQLDDDQWKELEKENEIFLIESRECDLCLKSSLSSHRCSACLSVQYCSTVCQKEDLKFHKTVCATWAKDKSRRIKGKDGQMDYWKSAIAKKKETFH